jgi:hypothetical protein
MDEQLTSDRYKLDPYEDADKLFDRQSTLRSLNRNVSAFFHFSPAERLDKTIVLQSVMQNGLVLKYVDEFKNDPDIVIPAVNQNGEAIKYTSDRIALEIIGNDGTKIQYASDTVILNALEANGNLCQYIEPDKLCRILLQHTEKIKDMNLSVDCVIGLIGMRPDFYKHVSNKAKLYKPVVVAALTSDPRNYVYVPRAYPEYLELIRLMPESVLPPIPTEFTREISNTKTVQTGPTCFYHASAKVFLHNRFEFIQPIDNSKYPKECDRFLDMNDGLSLIGLTQDMCTEGGYIHILLFVYLYFLGIESGKTTYYDMLGSKSRFMSMPKFFEKPENAKYKADLLLALTHINRKTNAAGIKWMNCWVQLDKDPDEDKLYQVIHKLTNLNFYVCLGLNTHAVIITDTKDGSYRIKNSWGEDYDIVKSLKLLFLQGKCPRPYCATDIECYLPINDSIEDLRPYPTLDELNEWIDLHSTELHQLKQSLVGGNKTKRFKKGRKSYKFKSNELKRITKRNKLKKK